MELCIIQVKIHFEQHAIQEETFSEQRVRTLFDLN